MTVHAGSHGLGRMAQALVAQPPSEMGGDTHCIDVVGWYVLANLRTSRSAPRAAICIAAETPIVVAAASSLQTASVVTQEQR